MNCPRQFSIALLCLTTLLTACGKKEATTAESTTTQPPAKAKPSIDPAQAQEKSYEATAEQLLSARLSEDDASSGWVRLFDGHTLFGWEMTGKANWRVEDGSIVVDRGEQCLLCTSSSWQDFELTFEFKATEKTNSGVFVRTMMQPEDPALDCYEINIAPDDNPFPTASIVKRAKVFDDAPAQTFDQWRRMTVYVNGQDVEVSLGDELVCEYSDPTLLSSNRIGLQHNSGRVAFRDIRIRPLGLKTMLDKDLSKWTKYPDMPGEFKTDDEGQLLVKGGRTQLESKQSYGDFVLLGEYKLPTPEMNSGIFFRCIPGDEMMGYECQVSNARKDDNALAPADHGTGGIFKRQEARFVAGEPKKWATVLLIAKGPQVAAWVNGVQVSNWEDTREAHENPRKGLRLDPGTIMIQGHDPGTDAVFKQLKIASIK